MTDKLTPEQRHRCMSRIRSKNTRPEMLVRKFLFAHGFRYRVNVRTLPGTPDIVLRRFKTAIFINGCFWHGHEGCRYYVLPKSNVEFWERKIERNRNRDAANHMRLRLMGWSVVQIWECQLKPRKRHDTLEGLLSILNRQVLHTYGEKEYDIAETRRTNRRRRKDGIQKGLGVRLFGQKNKKHNLEDAPTNF